VSQQAPISPYTSLTHSTYHLILRDPTCVNLLTYTPPTQNTHSLILLSQPASISPYTHPTHSPYHLILRDPTSVNLLKYTPPHSQYIQSLSRVPTSVNLPIYASHSQSIPPYSPRPNQRQSPHIHPPTQNTYSLILVSLPASISPFTHPTHSPYHLILRDPTSVNLLTYTPPHSQYIQSLSRVPTGVDLPTYILSLLFSFPTNTVGGRGCVEFMVIHVCVLTCVCVCVSVYAGVPRSPTFQ